MAALAVVCTHISGAAFQVSPTLTIDEQLSAVEQALYGASFWVFFLLALSGYLMFWPFVRHYFGEHGPVDLRVYATNRVLRLAPLYYVVVIVVLAVHGAPLDVWARFLTVTENFSSETVGRYIGPMWTLVVEVHFYLLLPVLAWAVARIAGGSIRRAALALLGLAAISMALRVQFVYLDPSDIWRYNIPTVFVFLVSGMLVALLRASWRRRPPGWLRGPLGLADVWILVSLPMWAVVAVYSYRLDILMAVASFLIIGACVLPLRTGPVTRALDWRPLAVLGVATYSLYLWHVPVLDVLLAAGIPRELVTLATFEVPIAVIVALVSYRLIEEPFLRLRGQWSRSSAEQAGRTRAPREISLPAPRPSEEPAAN